MLPILVIGDDNRLPFLADQLRTNDYDVAYYTESDLLSQKAPPQFSVAILGLRPTTTLLKKLLPGATKNAFLSMGLPAQEALLLAREYHCTVYDYMKDPAVAIQNAVATAEGAIALALSQSPCTLQSARVLVLGFGRCGEMLSIKCRLLGAQVTVCETATNPQAHALAHGFSTLDALSSLQNYDIIFNTVPYVVLTANLLQTATNDVCIFDLASAPGGTDFTYCQTHGKNAVLCPSLPARFAPKTSGQILADAIHARILKYQLI